ncbi:MAG: hypothetical protein P8K76_12425 [Candidatus Binatia bacterium]|jgi:hypothetical protein|nr:hypothetical protein [Candidatus Binatia bacterium]MDG1401921.1 hypothetical protein [Candidatus Binatia bacterium]MDG1959356.1 hypothetical protein [Candidatus Binatia bacterium]MDG2010582.1 hypothetical protein [Candidatus Binatia bacterium]HAC80365.1 hypothetical protein [Deltaproteobacteria bacterium]
MNTRNWRTRLRRFLFVCIAGLYILSVPWYRPADYPVEIVFGLPDWVAYAVACYTGVAILNSIAWMLQDPEVEGS